MSGSVMVFVASIIVFAQYSFFLGPALIGLIAAVFDFDHLRKREFEKILVQLCIGRAVAHGRNSSVLLDCAGERDQTTR